MAVDKTGTLTEGKPKPVTGQLATGFSEAELLPIAAGLEVGSVHPLASAIVQGAKDRNVSVATVQDFQSVTGKGVRGTRQSRHFAIGSPAMMREMSVEAGPVETMLEQLCGEGQTVM